MKSYFQCGKVQPGEPVRWVGVDADDCGGREQCDLYHLDATPYEHFPPTFPSAVCEPPKLRSVLPGVEEFECDPELHEMITGAI